MANTKVITLNVELIESGKKIIINKEDFDSEIHKQVRVALESDNTDPEDTTDPEGVDETGAEGLAQKEEGTEA